MTILTGFLGAGKTTLRGGGFGLWIALLTACCAHCATAQSVAQGPQASTTAPSILGLPTSDGPVPVRASFQLTNINNINDDADTVAFTGILTLVWNDIRQTFDSAKEGVGEKVYSGAYQFNEISPGWYPQVTLGNAFGQYDSRAVLMRVKPDGTCWLIEAIEAVVKVNLDMRRFPFDRQRLEAIFEIIGFDSREVAFDAEAVSASTSGVLTSVPQWTLERVDATTRTINAPVAKGMGVASAFVVSMAVQRQPLFMLRLVVIPLGLIVVLSWTVFWMDRSSLGDRMSVSFVGILTAVAYQITLGDTLPNISYFTLMNGFLNLGFLLMCVSVVINLRVAAVDRLGRSRADRIDRRCRWMFPLAYFGLTAIMVVMALIFF